jgi:hypothetical protein
VIYSGTFLNKDKLSEPKEIEKERKKERKKEISFVVAIEGVLNRK